MKKRLLTLFLGVFFMVIHAVAQQKVVTGSVTDEDRLPLPGVSVKIKGTNTGTSTDGNGKYSIRVEAGQVLVFSFIGSVSQERTVGNGNTIDVKLSSDAKALEEVVVVGYGTQKKSNLTGAVATIDVEKAIGTRPVTDLGRALQGASPGLTITTSSGDLGRNPSIRLRGLSGSLNGGGAKPLILLDNVEIQDLQMVNPDDIESISVLKDAASSSIYGTRAAWGVILITSKSGKKGAPARINYTNNFSFATPTTMPEIAPAADGAEMALAAVRRRIPSLNEFGIVGMYTDDVAVQKMREWEQQYGGQDLGDEMVLGRDFEIRNGHLFFYRPWDAGSMYMKDWAPQQKHNVNVSGGSDKTTYNLGLGYLGQDGVLKVNPDKFDRYNVNLSLNSSVTNWLDARGKVMVSNSTTTVPYSFSSATYGPWYYLYRWPQTFPYGTYEGQPFRNTITEVSQANMDKTKSNLARIQIGGTVKVIPGLTVDADYTYSTTNDHLRSVGGGTSGIDFWGGALNYSPNFQSAANDRVLYSSDWNEINTGKLYGTYSKNIKDHSFKIIAGGDAEYFQSTGNASRRMGMFDPTLGEISLATGDQFVSGYNNHWATLGGFGRVNYSFKNKYLLELNGRYDGSSKFPSSKQWGFFPSMSAGYVISEEPFMKFASPVMSFLKLRGSYGSIGNQDVGTYRFLSTIGSTNSNWWVGGNNMLTVGTPGALSPSLGWETVSTVDLGLDARVLNDELGVTFDWYRRTTSDMITAGVTLPSSFGTASPVRNYGEMQTTGWEVSLDWNKSFENGFRFNVTGTLSDFQEKITKFANTTKGVGSYYEGKILGEIWGYETDRFFDEDDFSGQDANGVWIPKAGIPNQDQLKGTTSWFNYGPGDIKYRDINGDGKVDFGTNTVDDSGDMRRIGNSTPRYQYGLRLGADFKGFDFNAFLQGVGKRDLWASGPIFIPGYRYGEAWYSHQTNYWTPENRDALYPRPTDQLQSNNNMNFRVQTKYMLNMAYLRMKNITLGYTLPKKLTDKISSDKVRLYLSGENLFEFDHLDLPIDPEVDYTPEQSDLTSFGRVYPYRRTVSFGLQVTL